METPSTVEPDLCPKPISASFDHFRERLEQTRASLPDQSVETEAERELEAQRERSTQWKRLVSESRLGDREHQSRFDTFQVTDQSQQNAIDALREYAENIQNEVSTGSGIVWLGPCGTGKDHLLIAMLRTAVAQHGYTAKWKYGLTLYGDMRDAISQDGRESELIAQYTTPTILALSDPVPPAGNLSVHQSTMLQRIIDERYRLKRPTWVTANAKDYADLGSRMGFPIADRLSDNALVIRCNWKGHRKPKRVVN